ncbi:MAG: STAS domain-containing protein [Acidobacteria bacterium]|jgi:anti-anti-sigma factor|nr:STAS domain-containing protein [Acidobacteriota bacterium]
MNDEQLKLSSEVVRHGLGVVAAAGYINNEGGQAVADAVEGLFEKGCSSLLIDLDGTRIINSIGVSILLEILEKLLDSGGHLAFCSLTPTIAKTFEIMGLAEYAQVFPDRRSALEVLGVNAV